MLVIAFFCFFYANNLGWNTIQFADCAKAALRWPVAEGHVNVVTSRRSTRKYYTYTVSGRQFTGNLFELPNPNPFHFFNKYKDGQRILVYFDPAAPQRASVNRTLDEKQYSINLIYASVAAIFGSIAFAAQVNEWTSHKQRLGFR